MNYHSDEWIMSKVREHYEEALEHFDENQIIGIFYQGSANYGLDYENSDVDTKLIVAPSFYDIAMNISPISTTHVRDNDEHIDFKDIRLYLQTFRKQNLNFLEILYTPYKIINPLYEEDWNYLVRHREEIVHYNEYRAIKAMQGLAKEKYFALEHRYPSRVAWLDKYGYDPKQLHHLFRITEYIKKYTEGKSYIECLKSDIPDYLISVKRGDQFGTDIDKVRKEAEEAINEIDKIINEFPKNKNINDEKVDKILDRVQYSTMRKAVICNEL